MVISHKISNIYSNSNGACCDGCRGEGVKGEGVMKWGCALLSIILSCTQQGLYNGWSVTMPINTLIHYSTELMYRLYVLVQGKL